MFFHYFVRLTLNIEKMKKVTRLLSGLFLLGMTITTSAQISTATGGAANVLPNSPTTNTNVGIGTNTPTAKLEVTGFGNNTQTFIDASDAYKKCVVLSVGGLRETAPNNNSSLGNRLLTFMDVPVSNVTPARTWFGIDDRNDSERLFHWAVAGQDSGFGLQDKLQNKVFELYEDGTNTFLNLPKAGSYFTIGGTQAWPIPYRFMVKNGASKFEGNVVVDTNVGIGTTNFVDGTDTYRLSVKGAIRADKVKVYTTWADYVFEKEYKLATLEEVEQQILSQGHLKDIPSAKEVEEKGIELGEMNKLLLQKVEELTLYMIELKKELTVLKSKIE